MAIDTITKRTSAIGVHWPTGTIRFIEAAEEYGGMTEVHIPMPVGTPELRRLTTRRTRRMYIMRHETAGYSTKRPRGTYITRRTVQDYSTRRQGGNISIRRR